MIGGKAYARWNIVEAEKLSASHGTCDDEMHLIWNNRKLRERGKQKWKRTCLDNMRSMS